MGWALLPGAVALQLVADLIRIRGWQHTVRDALPAGSRVRYRDAVVAHLAGTGWNGITPVHAGEAVKVGVMHRRLRDAPAATLAATVIPPSAVEAVLTLALVLGLAAFGVLAPDGLLGAVPISFRVPVLIAAGVAVVAVVAWLALAARGRAVARNAAAGLAPLRRPRMLVRYVLPWAAAARLVRLLAIALLLAGAGLPLALAPALVLMAVQGATPAAGPAGSAMGIGIAAAALPGAFAAGVSSAHVAVVLVSVQTATSAVNLAISCAVVGAMLRTASPRRVVAWLRAVSRREQVAAA